MNVFILTESYGEEIVGVYATRDLAEVALESRAPKLPADYQHDIDPKGDLAISEWIVQS